MKKRAILKYNEPDFLVDIKRCREVMVHAEKSGGYFRVTKGDILKHAETHEIRYAVTDKIFVQKRNTMVVF